MKVLLLDEERQILRIAATAGVAVPVGLELPLHGSYSGTVACTGEVFFSADTPNDPNNFLAAEDRAAGILTYLGLPIKARDRVLGVLTLNTETPRRYVDEEIAYLASFADRAALALEHVRLRDDLEERLYRTDAVAALNRLITSSLDLDRILDEITRAAARLMKADLVVVYTADEARQALEARAISDPTLWVEYPQRLMRFDEGAVGEAIRSRRTIHVADLDADPRTRAGGWFLDHGLRSGIAVPILHGDTAIGVLAIASRTVFAGRPEDDTLLQGFVDQAAIAITHARLYAAGQARIQRLQTVTRLEPARLEQSRPRPRAPRDHRGGGSARGNRGGRLLDREPGHAHPAAGGVLRSADGGGLAGAEPALRRGRARLGRPLRPRGQRARRLQRRPLRGARLVAELTGSRASSASRSCWRGPSSGSSPSTAASRFTSTPTTSASWTPSWTRPRSRSAMPPCSRRRAPRAGPPSRRSRR